MRSQRGDVGRLAVVRRPFIDVLLSFPNGCRILTESTKKNFDGNPEKRSNTKRNPLAVLSWLALFAAEQGKSEDAYILAFGRSPAQWFGSSFRHGMMDPFILCHVGLPLEQNIHCQSATFANTSDCEKVIHLIISELKKWLLPTGFYLNTKSTMIGIIFSD